MPFLESLVQYGIAGAVVAAVFVTVIAPLLKHLLSTNRQAIELLRRAVESNTDAVKAFQRFEHEEHQIHERIISSQHAIVDRLKAIEDHVKRNGNGGKS